MLGQKFLRVRWYSAWLTAIFEAQAFWTTEKHSSRFNTPLATLQEILRVNREERAHDAKIPVSGAVAWMGTKLPWYNARHINVEAWDTYAEFQSSFQYSRPEESRYNYAVMQLRHPVNPSVDPMLSYLRNAVSDESTMQFLTMMPQALSNLLVLCLAQRCYKSGRMTDVRWTLDFSNRLREQRMLGAGEVREHNGWGNQHRARKATPKEIAQGVPVDAQGRVIPVRFKGTAEETRERFEKASKTPAYNSRHPRTR